MSDEPFGEDRNEVVVNGRYHCPARHRNGTLPLPLPHVWRRRRRWHRRRRCDYCNKREPK